MKARRVLLGFLIGVWACALVVIIREPAHASNSDTSEEGARRARGPIGLVTIPTIFGEQDPNGPPGARPTAVSTSAIQLRAAPDSASKVVRTISSGNGSADYPLVSIEYDYEVSAALVYASVGDEWFEVRTQDGKSGWIRTPQAGRFISIESLLKSGGVYWEGFDPKILREQPGNEKPLFNTQNRDQLNALTLLEMPFEIFQMQYYKMENGKKVPDGKRPEMRVVSRKFNVLDRSEVKGNVIAQLDTGKAGELVVTLPTKYIEKYARPPLIPITASRIGWHQVRLLDGRLGWIKGDPQLGRIRDLDARTRSLASQVLKLERVDSDFEVTETRWVDNRLWARIKVKVGSGCEDEPVAAVAHGWVPVHSPKGDLNFGIRSRGC